MTDMKELEERAKAAPRWTWEMAGLVGSFELLSGERAPFVIVELPRRGLFVWSPTDTTLIRPDAFLERHPDARPDLSSPATLGCLLAMINKASFAAGMCEVWVECEVKNDHVWCIVRGAPLSAHDDEWFPMQDGPTVTTRAEALVVCLEDPYGRHRLEKAP